MKSQRVKLFEESVLKTLKPAGVHRVPIYQDNYLTVGTLINTKYSLAKIITIVL